MITNEFANQFALDWIKGWNCKDLDLVLSKYSDDFRMTSPFIQKLMAVKQGSLQGKTSVRAYWEHALTRLPDFQFELLEVFVSVRSVAIRYRGVSGVACEVFIFDQELKVIESVAHY